ncbi:MAG: HEAT repeat domain-containing protein [candidate division KSB1 bacterium]|nr:HEAT repeat domain-containing protein [candidate division KSB1 bacterium]MDZ7303787.1 HEAT repeat domain-containing protein [candidate division KSB1 bacterium]MDZ7313046.1 HEAT repeat domain-containing protein [candidate division KSB1 bacterium]
MKKCAYIQTLLPLFDSEELTPIEKRQVEDHLAVCQRCGEELAAIRALHADLQRVPAFEPSEAMLEELRRGLRRRLRQESLQPNWQERLGSWLFGNLRPVWQLGFVTALMLIGITIGRQFFAPYSRMDEKAWLSNLTAGKPVAVANGYVMPALANVQMIRIDPATRQIEIHFSMVNEVQLRGGVNEPAIRQALSYALREKDQLNLRLRAVKAIGETYVASAKPLDGDELTEALLDVLENDPNAGVRLKAAQVVKQLPLNSLVKNSLIRVLIRDENSAVRIQAIEALNRGTLTEEEMATLHAAAADTNAYIRLQARRLLSGQLEEALKNSQLNQIQ